MNTHFLRTARAIALIAAGEVTSLTAMSCASRANDTDSGSDSGNDSRIDGGVCSASVDEVLAAARSPQPGPACPARFDDVRDRGPCEGYTSFLSGPCGGALVFRGGCALDQFVCVYDSTTHQLNGAATSTDTGRFCGGATNCMAGGTLPAGFTCSALGIETTCQLNPIGADASTTTDASLDAQPNGG